MQEFSAISVSSYEAETLASKLNEQSAAGWDVVAIIPAGSSITAYLSRAATTSGPDTVSEPIVDAEIVGDSYGSGPTGASATESAVEDFGGEETGPLETIEQPADEVAAEVDTPAAAAPPVDVTNIGGPGSGDLAAKPAESAPSTPSTPSTPSLADEIAALVPQIESEESPAPATAEPAGWGAGSGTTETTETPAAQPTLPGGSTGATTEPAAAESTTTAASSPAMAPAGWYADPSGRYELRYWDGTQWTEHVSRAGQQYTDPPVA